MTLKDKVRSRGTCLHSFRHCIAVVGVLACIGYFLNVYLLVYTNAYRRSFSTRSVLKQTQAMPRQLLQDIRRRQNISSENSTHQNNQNGHQIGHQIRTLRNCSQQFMNSHFMSISYSGRTGNLLFQFASLIAIANLTCYTPVRQASQIHSIDGIFTLKNVKSIQYSRSAFKDLPEHGYATYDPNITSRILPNYNWTLEGYRQSFRYFQDFSDIIRASFCFNDDIKQRVAKFLTSDHFKGDIKVGIHVRRTDIAREAMKNRDVHILPDITFYNRAIAYMRERLRPSTISLIVISDDKTWCQNNIKGDYVVYTPFRSAGDDLYLFTQCDHHVLSVGTFSWMGAWLNETGIVVYDKQLHRYSDSTPAKGVTHSDYYPGHWVGL